MLNFIRSLQKRYFGVEALILIALVLSCALAIVLLGGVLIPIISSLILAYLMHGWVQRLSRFHVSPVISAFMLSIMLLCAMIFLLFVILPLIWEQLQLLYQELPDMLSKLSALMQTVLEKYNVDLRAIQVEAWQGFLSNQLAGWGRRLLSESVGTIIGLATLAIYLVLVPMLVFFLLRDGSKISADLRSRIRPDGMLISIWKEMDLQLANYVRGKAMEILLVGLISYVIFFIFDLRYTVLLSVLSGVSVLVPYVGAFIVTMVVALVSLIQWGLQDTFYYVLFLYALLQIVDGNVLVPVIFSDSVSLHPVSIVLAVLVFGGLWGFWGIFFAIPLATLVKAIYTAWPRARLDKAKIQESKIR